MDRVRVKKKLLTGALVLLVLAAGVTEAGVLQAPSTDRGWMAALGDDLSRALGWAGQAWGWSEVVSTDEEPETQSSPEPEAGADPPDSTSDISPTIDPDG